MKHPKLERLKGFLRPRPWRSNARNGQASQIPEPRENNGSPAADASQSSPSSTHPNCSTAQSQATRSIPSATPGRASSPSATSSLPPPQKTVSRPQAGQSLWDRAYEAVRDDDPKLLDDYERLLSLELPDSVISTTTSQNTAGQVGRTDRPENRINRDPRMRQDQLKKITDRGMEQADGKRIKYTVFGREFVLKDQVAQVAQFAKAMKGFVDEAVKDTFLRDPPVGYPLCDISINEAIKVSPEGSLAWAGVCVLLPVLTNPIAAEEANRDGLSYVTSRLRYYVELEHLLWPQNLKSQDRLKGEFEGHIVDLYQKILKFQIKTVLRFHRRWIANASRDVIGSDNWKEMISKVKELEEIVLNESSTVNTIASQETLKEIHEAAKQHNNELQSLLSIAKEQLNEHKITNELLAAYLRDLPVVHDACYNSTDVQDGPKCDDGTRIHIRDDINRWVEEDSEETLFWLVGPMGTGKSTIARTVADSFARNSRPVAGYFFKRGQQGRNDTSRLFPTLAVQMANSQAIPSFKRCLWKHVDGLNKDAVEKMALEFQFDKLLRLPLADLPPTDTEQLPLVIIIDALDECERPEHLEGILSLLSKLRNIPQVRLRVMLTSRSAPSIADAFGPLLENKTARRLEIHREFLEETKKDIRIFLEAEFANIRLKCRVPNPWPLPEDMDRLVQLATAPEPLFIYAATLCRFVYNPNKPRSPANYPRKQLDRWLEQSKDSKSQIQQIYEPILDQIFAGNNKAGSDQQLQFLGALVLLADPLCASSLAALLAVDADDLIWWLPELHAVLDIPSEPHKPLSLLHKSFSDFLLDSDGLSVSPYRVDVAGTHSLLAEKCVQRMEAELKQNICNIRELDATLDDIPKEEIRRCIPDDLRYACIHWVYHVQGSGQPPGDYVHTFLHKHFLHWLEALSLLGRLSDGAIAIRWLLDLIKHFPDTPLELVDLVKDAGRVISSFGSIIERIPLQIYGTLLFFTPTASKVRQIFWNQRMPRLDPIQGVRLDWDAYLQTLEGHDSDVHGIAFSPDGQVMASGSRDLTVQLWSATTGAHLRTLEGHGEPVDIVVFFDNKTLASGSRDGTVRIWNLQTGNLLHTLNEERRRVTAVALLPDGEHVASASRSSHGGVQVRLWNLKTGALSEDLFPGDRSRDVFQKVAFSPDCQLMASSGYTITIWDFPTGSHRCTLKGHSKMVTSMVFSHNNQLLASGSRDRTIRLWNIDDGVQIYALPDHHERPTIAFSPNGRFLASSWTLHDIEIWNVASGTKQGILLRHQSHVKSVAFSPDSQLLASGSDVIKLWNVELLTHQHPVDGHSDAITRVIFSPDGQLVATSSFDKTVRLWNASTGICLRTFNDHNGRVWDVAFSPDGNLLASDGGSAGVRIWNVENGTLQEKIDEQSLVTAVDYSTDGQLAAVASLNTITLYNAATGVNLFTLEGHSDTVKTVVFSPDSQILASLSRDDTIRLWETNKGMLRNTIRLWETNKRMLRHVDISVSSEVVFSPDSQFLAFALLNSIVVQNVKSAEQQTLQVEYDAFDISIITLSPDNQLLAIQAGDYEQKSIEIWNITTGKSWHTLQVLDRRAEDILFSPDSEIVAVAARDRTVWLWKARTHEHLFTIENPNDCVIKLKFSPDGQTLATASRDKMVRLWDIKTGSHIQMFQYESGVKDAWCWNLLGSLTLKAHKFPLTAAAQIGMPEPTTLGINIDVDGEWITKDAKRLIWLPPEYRPRDWNWAKTGSTIFIGSPSGRVLRVQDI